jgi:hypothetical protein
MNTGQVMLTSAAMVLLGVTSVSVNSRSLSTGTIVRQTEIGVYAISLATSYLEKAEGMAYDRYDTTAGVTITALSQLTPVGSLGIETAAGEIPNVDSTWDDFDDFNKMNIYDTKAGIDVFNTLDTVYYVNDFQPDVAASTQTWNKRMDIKTCGTLGRGVYEGGSSTGVDTIKLSYVYSYFQMP